MNTSDPRQPHRSRRVTEIIDSRPPFILRHGTTIIAVLYIALIIAAILSGIFTRS